jgi:hypothetical protein
MLNGHDLCCARETITRFILESGKLEREVRLLTTHNL